jgi:hypothetical protein
VERLAVVVGDGEPTLEVVDGPDDVGVFVGIGAPEVARLDQ